MQREGHTILVLRALGLGDLLTALPALRGLRAALPDHRVVLACPAWLEPLALHAGAVDEVLPTAPLEPVALARSAALGVNLHGRGPQSHRALLAARPRRLIAFAHPDVPESAGGPRHRSYEHEVERWCRLLSESGIPADPRRIELDPPPLLLPADVRGATVIHPGAASGARRWPVERFAAVARSEAAQGRAVVVTGSPAERELARAVARAAGLADDAVWAGRTDLLGLTALVAAAGRLVSGDTGVAHLATALRTSSVLLFGPTSPELWGPPPDMHRQRVLWAGRTGDPHADTPDPGLLSIEVTDVVAELARLDRTTASGERRQPLRAGTA